jgi:hypothetical protein
VSKTIWLVLSMGLLSMLALAIGMMVSLEQFQETPAAEWVKLAEQAGRQFKASPISLRVNLRSAPRSMVINYTSLVDSHYDLSLQNAEMESIAKYAIQNYSLAKKVDEVQVTRTETHGRGCFRQTFVSQLTYPNPDRKNDNVRYPVGTPPPPPPER